MDSINRILVIGPSPYIYTAMYIEAMDAQRPPKGLELRAAPAAVFDLEGLDPADAALIYVQRLDRITGS